MAHKKRTSRLQAICGTTKTCLPLADCCRVAPFVGANARTQAHSKRRAGLVI